MQLIHEPGEFQRAALELRAEGRRTALVPTMGALHEGHLQLLRTARERVGAEGRVMASIFVNPIQFDNANDLARYPRTLERDAELCAGEGVDVIFAPTHEAMYPADFRTFVEVEKLPDVLCGAHRPGHFRGVTTVVMKLFMLAQPSVALFGWKDAQQFLILRRMVHDLCLPLEMVGVETVREADGLARSSRNAYLTPEERTEAARIHAGLRAARELFARGERDAEMLVHAAREPIEACALFRLEYAELRALETLDAQAEAQAGNSLLAVAAHLGKARLIDNVRF